MDVTSWIESARRGDKLVLRYDAAMMSTQPLVDDVRELVTDADIPWLLKNLLTYEDEDRTGFFSGLLAKFSTRPDVAEALQAAWFDANDAQRSKILWRIADLPTLSEEWHRRIFNFVIDAWDVFQPISMKFYGKTSASGMSVIAERYLGTRFTPTKRWLYLCNSWFLRKEFPNIVAHFRDVSLASEFGFEKEVCMRLIDTHRMD